MCACHLSHSTSHYGSQLVVEELLEECEECAKEQERIEQLELDAEFHCECGNWKDPDAHLCQACLADAEKSMREAC